MVANSVPPGLYTSTLFSEDQFGQLTETSTYEVCALQYVDIAINKIEIAILFIKLKE